MDGHSIYIYIYKEPKTDEVKNRKLLKKIEENKKKKEKNEQSKVKLIGNN